MFKYCKAVQRVAGTKVNDKIDLKEIERRAYTSYHEDGIVDILIGVCVLTMSLYVFAEMFWLVGSMVAVYTPMYMGMKQKITFPRLGQVTFSKSRNGKTRRSFTFLVALNVVAVLMGFYFWMAFAGGTPPSWFPLLVEYFAVVIGVIGAGILAVVARLSEIDRFNRYAAATLIAIPSAKFLGTPFLIHIAVLGVFISVSGYLQLQRFKRKYPLIEEI